MAFFCFRHTQKNALAFFVPLPLGQIAVGLCGLDFGLPIAFDYFDRLFPIFWILGHGRLKLKGRGLLTKNFPRCSLPPRPEPARKLGLACWKRALRGFTALNQLAPARR